ncbi:MAG: sigma factor-like helix-turn-helix DNA-binding protein, partial [Gammaproteobacteria bacterium]
GLNYEEIAKICNCPVGTVRSRIFRGRQLLDEIQISINNEAKKNNGR